MMERPHRHRSRLGGHFQAPCSGVSRFVSPALRLPQGGRKRLHFGAMPLVYSKTSHVLNEEQGDKEAPRPVHLPAWHPRGRSCRIAPAGMRGTERVVPTAIPSALPAPLAHGLIPSQLPGAQTDLPTICKTENIKGIFA